MKSFLTDFGKISLKHFLLSLGATLFYFFICLPDISAQGVKQTGLTISVDNAPIQNVLSLIEKESPYRFIYNSDLKALQQKVSLTVKATPIKDLLNDLFNKTDLVYTLMENNMIVINEIVQNNFADDDRIVNGKVTAEGGTPLAGVSVLIKGTNKGVTTKSNGEYYISVSDSDVLVFSYVGYETQQISVAGKLTINVSLVSSKQELTQVVVVGYGTQRKIDVTGATGSVKGSELVKEPVLTATQAIQGKVAGVQIISSGQPGSAPSVRIRGTGSILAGVNPLFVVDGVITDDISNVNTADVLSVDVLKDASSEAIYGSRAANGVVLITTKQGTGKMRINVSSNVGVVQATHLVQMANTAQYIAYEKDALAPVGFTRPSPYNTDWYNEILRQAFYQNENLTLSGASDKNKYLLSLGYNANEGIIINNNFNRLTARLNNEFTPTNYIKVGINASYSNGVGQNIPLNTVVSDAYRASPVVPGMLNGKFGNTSAFQNVGNPILDAQATNDQSIENKVQGTGYIEIKPISSITLKSSFGDEVDFYNDRQYTYQHPDDTTFFTTNGGSQGPPQSNLVLTYKKYYHWTWDNTIAFTKTFNKQKINVLAGTSAEKYQLDGYVASRPNVPANPALWYLDDGNQNLQFNNSTNIPNEYTINSYFGRIVYSYDDKYLLTANFRADGSSVFNAANRWGYFPGISAGWVITRENFMENQHLFDFLKLRASWGQVGNSAIPVDASSATLVNNVPYFLNTSGNSFFPLAGSYEAQIKDLNLKWEVNTESDLGIEYSMLKSRLTGEIDVYDKKTSNALIYVHVPGTFGSQLDPNSSIPLGYVLSNAVEIENKGLEISARWSDKISSKLSYHIGGNISFNKNNVNSLNGGSPYYDGNINGYLTTLTTVGHPIGSFTGGKVIGVFQTQDEVNNYKSASGVLLEPNAEAGSLKYQYNSNGTLDTTFAGSYQPKAFYGIDLGVNYGNFDLSVTIYGNYGNQIYNGKKEFRTVISDNIEASVAKNRWTPTNHSQTEPDAADDTNLPNSTYFVESGSFIRINNITLGYTVPAKKIENMKWISSIRVFANAQNPVTLTKYSGFSPELQGGSATTGGVDLNTYPSTMTFAFGLNVGF